MTTYHVNKAEVTRILAELGSTIENPIPQKGYKTLIELPFRAVVTVINQPNKEYPKLPYSVTVEPWKRPNEA